jgi:hypothetical protein
MSDEALLARYAEDRRGDRVKPLTPEHGRLFLPALRARHELELNPLQYPDGTELKPDSISATVSRICRRLGLPKG